MPEEKSITVQADWIIPVDRPPIPHGVVKIESGCVVEISESGSEVDQVFDGAAIIPGLVNAHTHLELSGMHHKKLVSAHFTEWLGHVIRERLQQNERSLLHAVQRGIDASISGGATTIGDVTTAGLSWRPLQKSGLRGVVFCELLGLTSERGQDLIKSARNWLQGIGAEWAIHTTNGRSPESKREFPNGSAIDPFPLIRKGNSYRRLRPSLSPHAPYSTSPAIYEAAADWSAHCNVPLTTHLAETREELELLKDASGPLRRFLEQMGAWSNHWNPPGNTAADFVSGGTTSRAGWILAHGNYLAEQEIASLAAQRESGMLRAVVYCPRTHAYFVHTKHPFAQLREAGIPVAIGTDSMASNPNLNMLEELRFLALREPDLDRSEILTMGTLNGATALGLGDHAGSLTPGKCGDFAVVQLPEPNPTDPYLGLFESTRPVIATFVAGKMVFRRMH